MLAARQGHSAVLAVLLDAGAAGDCRDSQSMTALHFACLFGRCGAAGTLLRRGCAVDARTAQGQCALTLACLGHDNGPSNNCRGGRVQEEANESAQLSVVRLLVQHGNHSTCGMYDYPTVDTGAQQQQQQQQQVQPSPLLLAARRGWLRMLHFLADNEQHRQPVHVAPPHNGGCRTDIVAAGGGGLQRRMILTGGRVAAAKDAAVRARRWDAVKMLEKVQHTHPAERALTHAQQLLALAWAVRQVRRAHASADRWLSNDLLAAVARQAAAPLCDSSSSSSSSGGGGGGPSCLRLARHVVVWRVARERARALRLRQSLMILHGLGPAERCVARDFLSIDNRPSSEPWGAASMQEDGTDARLRRAAKLDAWWWRACGHSQPASQVLPGSEARGSTSTRLRNSCSPLGTLRDGKSASSAAATATRQPRALKRTSSQLHPGLQRHDRRLSQGVRGRRGGRGQHDGRNGAPNARH
jgi:hypothetical protein|eukprot:COSAG01_NODE_1323_length_10735_cov_9.245769_1_plen_470_part_00